MDRPNETHLITFPFVATEFGNGDHNKNIYSRMYCQ